MNSNTIKYIVFSIGLIFLANNLWAQHKKADSPRALESKGQVTLYLKTFDRYANNPDDYANNAQDLLSLFGSSKSKIIHNFLSKEHFKGDFISPLQFHTHIVGSYPDGLGTAFSVDSIELLDIRGSIFSKTHVFKAPVEYSGIRKDGKILSFADHQYFYIRSAGSKKSISRIASADYHNKVFRKKMFREGLFLEISSNIVAMAGMFPYRYSSNGNPFTYEAYDQINDFYYTYSLSNELTYSGDYRTSSAYNGLIFNLVYMPKPWFGFGVGYGKDKHIARFEVSANQYIVADEIQGFIPILNFAHFYHYIKVEYSAVPVFVRFQTGKPKFNFSFDLGAQIQVKPSYESSIWGNAEFTGLDLATNQMIYSHPTLPFGKYEWDDDVVRLTQENKSYGYLFGRINMNIQPSKYFYFRISSAMHLLKLNYADSWHMFDMHALRLGFDENSRRYSSINIELALGLHISELF
jgi:hypothetical protein